MIFFGAEYPALSLGSVFFAQWESGIFNTILENIMCFKNPSASFL
jgi:hypothetical protein